MLKRKLEVLGYQNNLDSMATDREVFANIVIWLEDQKIRLYVIEDRQMLRHVENVKAWQSAYEKYCNDLNMPALETQLEQLTWLVGHATRLDFLDDPGQYETINSNTFNKQSQNKIVKSAQPKVQSIFEVQDKEFITGVRALAGKLKIPHHPNHLLQLEAVARIVHERLSPAAAGRASITGTPFPFEQGNDVVSVNDAALDYPMRILRLLQIQSLRQLQTHINETIVAVQNLTANPKTDTKLGKVGR